MQYMGTRVLSCSNSAKIIWTAKFLRYKFPSENSAAKFFKALNLTKDKFELKPKLVTKFFQFDACLRPT